MDVDAAEAEAAVSAEERDSPASGGSGASGGRSCCFRRFPLACDRNEFRLRTPNNREDSSASFGPEIKMKKKKEEINKYNEFGINYVQLLGCDSNILYKEISGRAKSRRNRHEKHN